MTIILQAFFGSRSTQAAVITYSLDLVRDLDQQHGAWLRTAILLVAVAEEPQRAVARRFGLPELWLEGYVREFRQRLLQ